MHFMQKVMPWLGSEEAWRTVLRTSKIPKEMAKIHPNQSSDTLVCLTILQTRGVP